MFASLVILIQIMQVIIREIGSPLLATTYLLEKNLVTWRSKKQDVSISSAEAEYGAMTHIACEMMWFKNLLLKLVLDSLDLCLCFMITNLLST